MLLDAKFNARIARFVDDDSVQPKGLCQVITHVALGRASIGGAGLIDRENVVPVSATLNPHLINNVIGTSFTYFTPYVLPYIDQIDSFFYMQTQHRIHPKNKEPRDIPCYIGPFENMNDADALLRQCSHLQDQNTKVSNWHATWIAINNPVIGKILLPDGIHSRSELLQAYEDLKTDYRGKHSLRGSKLQIQFQPLRSYC